MSPSTTPVWRGINATEAETRLRRLQQRRADLDEALQAQQEMQKIHPNSFAVSLARENLEARQNLLTAELTELLLYRVNEPVCVALEGRQFRQHSAGIATLGLFLMRLQKLYSAIAQAMQSGPTLRGPIASYIREATELRLAEVYPSSFGMELYVPSRLDLLGQSISSDSLHMLFRLLSASTNEKSLMSISGALGGRTTAHLRHLASQLASTDSSMSLTWSDYTGRKHKWDVSRDLAVTMVSTLRAVVQTKSEVKHYTGILGGGSLFRNHFELLVRGTDTLIEGSMVPAVAPELKKHFGTAVSITVDETEVLDSGSGERRTYYVLTAIDDGVDEVRPAPTGIPPAS